MSDQRHPVPNELRGVVERLEKERPRATDLELDRIKLKAMTVASPGATAARPGIGPLRRSRRVVSVALAVVLMAGGGAVVAKSGGPSNAASSKGASNSQYCPPSSPGAGKPKKPGPAKCGKAP